MMWPFARKPKPKYTYTVTDIDGKVTLYRDIRRVTVEREYVRIQGDGVDVLLNMNAIAKMERKKPRPATVNVTGGAM